MLWLYHQAPIMVISNAAEFAFQWLFYVHGFFATVACLSSLLTLPLSLFPPFKQMSQFTLTQWPINSKLIQLKLHLMPPFKWISNKTWHNLIDAQMLTVQIVGTARERHKLLRTSSFYYFVYFLSELKKSCNKKFSFVVKIFTHFNNFHPSWNGPLCHWTAASFCHLKKYMYNIINNAKLIFLQRILIFTITRIRILSSSMTYFFLCLWNEWGSNKDVGYLKICY